MPVLWNPLSGGKGWKVQQLSCPHAFPVCSAQGVNDMREIVGFAFYSDWTFNIPILWRPVNGQPQTWRVSQLATLASPGSGYLMNADWINNIGQIVGEGDDANFNWVATFWNSRASGTIKLIVPNNAVSLVRRVNDLGFAAGTYSSETCSWCAFVEQLPRKP